MAMLVVAVVVRREWKEKSCQELVDGRLDRELVTGNYGGIWM
jgi:hypothetical protein